MAGCGVAATSSTELELTSNAFEPAPTLIATTAPIEFPTPTPTATAPPPPTAVPTAEPTATALPVIQPPTATAAPLAQPTATALPVATATAVPTAPPTPTATVPPTAVPPTPTIEPTAAPTSDAALDQGQASVLERPVTNAGYVVLGSAGGVPLRLPAARVELVGYHEAGHPGSQGITVAASGLPTMVLETRNRGTDARSASDIVVPPNEPIFAPVTGTVVAANAYVLYCKHDDKLIYIEPDGLPGWQVRVFHVRGTTPNVGDRVVAGETQIADAALTLPFESQIDEFTAEPSWPHVHLEVVDTSVPDDRPAGPGCP